MGTHTAVLLVPPPPPPPADPLGHLMLGSSLRNQGRYLWNCSTDGRAEPAVGLTQVFKQARESTKRAGGSRQQHPPRPSRPCPALPCACLPSGSPRTPTAVKSRGICDASTDGRSAPLVYANCWDLQAGGKQSSGQRNSLHGASPLHLQAQLLRQDHAPTSTLTPLPWHLSISLLRGHGYNSVGPGGCNCLQLDIYLLSGGPPPALLDRAPCPKLTL